MSRNIPLIALKGASIRFGAEPLFADLEISITQGERSALVGRNGSGKSTLLRILAGRQEPDEGSLWVQPGTRISYLEQEPDFRGCATVEDYIARALTPDRADETFRIDAAMDKLGLVPGTDPMTLSGGGQRRVALAQTLASAPDVMMLDEPTNHLDLPTIEWLETTLENYRGAVITISHDRAFLRTIARRIHWLDRGSMRSADIGFDRFDSWTESVLEEEERARERLDRKITEETRWLHEGLTARRKRNMGRVRALQEMRRSRREAIGPAGRVRFDPAEAERSGNLVIEARDITRRIDTPEGPRTLVAGFSTRIQKGDRVGLIGPNGAGKTTLVRMLLGMDRPDSGSVRLGANIEPAYFDQTRASLNPDDTLRTVLLPQGGDTIMLGERSRHIASYARDFLFDPGHLDSPVRSLSGGERNRLLLAKLFAAPTNLLALDEPTNDLDMETLDVLQEVLSDYSGTLLVISHDRDFLDRLVTGTIAVDGDGKVTEYAGGYTDYLSQRPEPPARQSKSTGRPGGKSSGTAESRTRPSQSKLSYKDQRELDQLPERIEVLRREISALEAALADPEAFSRDPEGFEARSRQLASLRDDLDAAEDRWLALSLLAEELAGS